MPLAEHQPDAGHSLSRPKRQPDAGDSLSPGDHQPGAGNSPSPASNRPGEGDSPSPSGYLPGAGNSQLTAESAGVRGSPSPADYGAAVGHSPSPADYRPAVEDSPSPADYRPGGGDSHADYRPAVSHSPSRAAYQVGAGNSLPGAGQQPGAGEDHRRDGRAYLRNAGPDNRTEPPVGLVTCPYRGERANSLSAILEALGIGADFIPSTLVSRAIEGVSFALGSTIVIPRSVLEEIGGFEPLLDELADDYRLGNGVGTAGYRVILSDYVIDDILGAERFSLMWSRRLRWSRTLRVCRPAGYAGAFVTYGFALAILFLIAAGFSAVGWVAFAVVSVVRLATVLTITQRYTGDRATLRFLPLLPVSDLLGLALYVASFFGSHIVWRGERFRLLAGGRLLRED